MIRTRKAGEEVVKNREVEDQLTTDRGGHVEEGVISSSFLFPLKSDLRPFFFRPDSSSLPRDEFARKRGFSVVNLMASRHL